VKPTRDELLSHEADGIREFDNALPRWWLYGFYFTIAFAAVYLVNYHVLAKPLFGAPSLAAEYAADVERASRGSAPSGDHGPAVTAVAALTDRDSLEKGRAIFEGPDNTCFACHRADLGGLVGPNLTDRQWLHGCTAGDLVRDVKGGFPQKGMLPFGTGKVLTDDQVLQVVSYVLSKQGSNPPNPKPIDPERDTECGP
jgi:cytochrome c oxidase cbb3-type subunit 3